MAAMLGVLVCIYAIHIPPDFPQDLAGTFLLASLVALVLLMVFAVGIPHALAIHSSEGFLARSLWVLYVLRVPFWPVARTLAGVEFIVRRLLGKPEQNPAEETRLMEQEILAAVSEGQAHGAVAQDQKEIIKSVFRLTDTAVSAIMTPRTDLHAVPATANLEEARQTILRSGHSRIPVYEQSIDHIIGVLYAKDLLRLEPGEPFDARRLMRGAPYVPETKTINDLLDEFRRTKVQIAIVLDEYGGTAGIVTIEDILEELVGEIADEYDQAPSPSLVRIDADTLEVDARVRVDEINEALGVALPEEEDYETIGGFALSQLGRIPAAGEQFRHAEVHFSVVAAEPRKITRLRIHVQREP